MRDVNVIEMIDEIDKNVEKLEEDLWELSNSISRTNIEAFIELCNAIAKLDEAKKHLWEARDKLELGGG